MMGGLCLCEEEQGEAEPIPLEASACRTSRLEMIGQLTSGIAHDFNNLLGGIVGHASRLQARDSLNEADRETVDLLLGGALRAADLVDRLLSFARGGVSCRDLPGDINQAIEETLALASRPALAHVTVTKELGCDVPGVCVANSELVQIVLNLVLNALDAMPDGGELHVSSGRMTIPPVGRGGDKAAKAGTYAFVRVADTGCGMEPEVRDRIFEPFFTTKGEGRGTGLGLAMTDQLVKTHGGIVDVDSKPGQGSVFRVCFPVSDATET